MFTGVFFEEYCQSQNFLSGPEFKRELATFDKVTSDPLLRDPYESKMVEATTSKVPGANEGLYAKIKIEPNTTLAFYNGKRIKPKSKDDYDHPDWEKVILCMISNVTK